MTQATTKMPLDMETVSMPASPVEMTNLDVVAGFSLLFTVSLDRRLTRAETDAAALAAGLQPFTVPDLEAYQVLRGETERHVFGPTFIAAERLTHTPLGRMSLALPVNDAQCPTSADVHLFTHVSGVALWEIWLPGLPQRFDTRRWVAWLDEQAADSLPARLWQVLAPLNRSLGGMDTYRQYLPCSVVRLLNDPLAVMIERHADDVVGLLWRDRSTRTLKPAVVEAELQRDYCAREGGITLLGRRCAVDMHDRSDDSASQNQTLGLPPRSAVPFIVTLELLLVERAVLLQLYEQLSSETPSTIEGLLQLKQQVTDGLEEYYGATLAATRFGDAVAEDGEEMLGIVALYDALIDRLEAVSFALTTRYQQRMTQMQFWLTVVFGATEIGFIAASLATWHYRTELGAVLAWTVAATVVSAGVLVGLLRPRMQK
jgi:hypothetical protein